jgi:hypothetical protein
VSKHSIAIVAAVNFPFVMTTNIGSFFDIQIVSNVKRGPRLLSTLVLLLPPVNWRRFLVHSRSVSTRLERTESPPPPPPLGPLMLPPPPPAAASAAAAAAAAGRRTRRPLNPRLISL